MGGVVASIDSLEEDEDIEGEGGGGVARNSSQDPGEGSRVVDCFGLARRGGKVKAGLGDLFRASSFASRFNFCDAFIAAARGMYGLK